MRRSICAGAVCLVTALAGCGGDDGGEEEESGATGAAVETVKIRETEFKLDPSNPTIEKTGVVAFEVANEGEAEHSLEVEGPKGEAELEKNLEPGGSATLEVDLDKPGRYVMYCPVGNHRDLGMEGRVTVGSGESSTPGGDEDTQSPGGGSPY
jgi:uncharacterized cupredoxin-like copper-binding protein